MACRLDTVMDIWKSNIGYHEKASNKQLDDPYANAGSGNYTKFARDLYNAGFYNGNKNGYAYCDVAFDWHIWKACGCNKNEAESMIFQTGDLGAGAEYSAQYYKNAGRWFSDPKPGDQFFTLNYNHTGIVEYVDNYGIIHTIEANRNDCVCRWTYTIDELEGFGRPNYISDSYEGEVEMLIREVSMADQDYDPYVENIQILLKAKGYKLPKYGADGCFGYETFQAVTKFQKDSGIGVDGIVGCETMSKLLGIT